MERVYSLKMLAVLALVLLVSSVNGRIMTKCELKAQLDAAQIYVPDNMILENLIASLVCRANGSAFNTKFVKFVTDNHDGQLPLQGSPPPRHQDSTQRPTPPRPQDTHQGQPQSGPQDTHQGQPQSGPQDTHQGQPQSGPQDTHQGQPQSGPQDTHQGQPQSGPQDTHQGQPLSGSQGFPQVPPPPGPKQSSHKPPQQVKSLPQGPKGPRKHKRFARQERDLLPPAVWHQFGLFQLSDTVACNSGVLSSLNICKMNCSALIEDDITNDIICMNTLMQQVKPTGQVNPAAPIRMEDLLGKECEHVDASHYFSDCV
nr:uncharacterized protein LOC129445488 [Misgurnus anguillicaudatus]